MLTSQGTTLFRAFLLCLLSVALVFAGIVAVVWFYNANMLEREQDMVFEYLPELDAAYGLTAATSGLQSQGILLSLSSDAVELTQRRDQLDTTLSRIKGVSESLTFGAVEQEKLSKEIALLEAGVGDISLLRAIELDLTEVIATEQQSLLKATQQLGKLIQANIVIVSDQLLNTSDEMSKFNPVMSNSAEELAMFTDQVAAYDEDNLEVQDYLLLNQDLVSLAAVVEQVPLLPDSDSVQLAEQNADLLFSALVARSIYINDKATSAELLESIRALRERLRTESSLFIMQRELLEHASSQITNTGFLAEHTMHILEIAETVRQRSRDSVNSLAQLTLESVSSYRWWLLLLSAVAMLMLAAIAYWLLYRKTVQPLLDITQRVTDVGSERFTKQNTQYFLSELTTLSDAVERLDDSQKAQQQQEKQLTVANANLKQANEELQQFAHVASHDLQEPLRKLRQFSDILEEDYGSVMDEEGRFFLNTIRNSALRMSELIKDTLAYSRSGSANQSIEVVQLSAVANELWEEIELAVDDAQGQLELQRLPTIMANKVGVSQLFRNLLVNALKYRKPDEPAQVTISCIKLSGTDSGMVCVRVQDNGVGIATEHLSRIFVPFERLHSGGVAGTGLGLSICKKVCDAHGWNLNVKSELNVGTLFEIRIPVSAVVAY